MPSSHGWRALYPQFNRQWLDADAEANSMMVLDHPPGVLFLQFVGRRLLVMLLVAN